MEMDLELISIGNSKGLRLPKALIEACGFEKTIHVDFEDGKLILSASRKVRHNWKQKFVDAILTEEKGEDLKEWSELTNDFDENEWTW